MGQKQQDIPKAPNLSKEYEKGIQLQMKYTPQQVAEELGLRYQYDPAFVEQALSLQHAYDPWLAGEQQAAVLRRDPAWYLMHQDLGSKIGQALDRGYIDANRAAAYKALGKQVTSDTLRGSTASPEMTKQMTQAILSRQPSLSYGEAQDMAAAVYTGQRGQALQQQRQAATNQFLGQASERAQALAQAGSYLSSPTMTQMINQTQGVTPPRQFGYMNPNAGYMGQQGALQNYQNQLGYSQLSGGGSNPWMNALQGAGSGAMAGAQFGGGYGAIAGGVIGGLGGYFG